MEVLKGMEVFLADSQGRIPKLDPKQLKAGQHVQILTGGVPDTHVPEIMIHSTMIAGTVKVMDGDRVVLQDVVLINEARSQNAVPIVSKVPYVSRRFKSTGPPRRQGISIPGEIALERSKILHACELTGDNFKTIRQNGGEERIGVDFDLNVADGEETILQQ